MRPHADNVDFEGLLTYLVPGVLVLVALHLILGNFSDVTLYQSKYLGKHLGAEIVAAAVYLALAIAAGFVLSAVELLIEERDLDRFAARIVYLKDTVRDGSGGSNNADGMQRAQEEFDRIWDWYIVNLEKCKNPYVSRLALRLHSSIRHCLALALVGMGIFPSCWQIGTLAWVASFILVWLSYKTSVVLAKYRHGLFIKTESNYRLDSWLKNFHVPNLLETLAVRHCHPIRLGLISLGMLVAFIVFALKATEANHARGITIQSAASPPVSSMATGVTVQINVGKH